MDVQKPNERISDRMISELICADHIVIRAEENGVTVIG